MLLALMLSFVLCGLCCTLFWGPGTLKHTVLLFPLILLDQVL